MSILDGLKRNIRRRYEFIEFQLTWNGKIRRKQLQDQFAISPQQATNDLGDYIDSFPDNVAYNPRDKAYVPGLKFEPELTTGEVPEYLMHLEMLLQGYRDKDEVWPTFIPEIDAVSIRSRPIKSCTFKQVLSAIKTKQGLRVHYTSLSSEGRNLRTIKPHAIAYDGHRWHVRAYDCENMRHSDFVLSRLEAKGLIETAAEETPRDEEWDSQVTLVLSADELLQPEKRKQLETEYRMRNGRLTLRVRKAMLFYYLRFYGFNPFKKKDGAIRNESSFHLQIVNLEEVEEWLGRRS